MPIFLMRFACLACLTAPLGLLSGCAAPPPPVNSGVQLPAATLPSTGLSAVFWADKIRHTRNLWPTHPATFSFRLENIPASQILELISTEIQLGYEMDSCGEARVSLVGRNMPLQQIIESLELQAGASIQFEGNQLIMRCEADQLRVPCPVILSQPSLPTWAQVLGTAMG